MEKAPQKDKLLRKFQKEEIFFLTYLPRKSKAYPDFYQCF